MVPARLAPQRNQKSKDEDENEKEEFAQANKILRDGFANAAKTQRGEMAKVTVLPARRPAKGFRAP